MSIYTRTGDTGQTSLRGDQARVSKGSLQIAVLGSLDQLNAALGLSRSMLDSFLANIEDQDIAQPLQTTNLQIQNIQSQLLSIGAIVAEYNPKSHQLESKLVTVQTNATPEHHNVKQPNLNTQLQSYQDHTQSLEQSIDQMDATLTELHNFILPGGSVPGAQLHLARTQCRQTERDLVRWLQSIDRSRERRRDKNSDDTNYHQQQWAPVLSYLNRLSDWLFTAARSTNHVLQQPEDNWTKQ